MSAERTTNAVGYIRVASGSQKEREESSYLQRQAILKYTRVSNINIVRFFADHACIAEVSLRQGLSDALAYSASGKASALVVAELATITDSLADLQRFIEQQRILHVGPALISVRERLDTSTVEGRVMLHAICGVAQPAPRDLAEGM